MSFITKLKFQQCLKSLLQLMQLHPWDTEKSNFRVSALLTMELN